MNSLVVAIAPSAAFIAPLSAGAAADAVMQPITRFRNIEWNDGLRRLDGGVSLQATWATDARATITFALKKVGGTWLISGWSWDGTVPQAGP